MLVSLAAARFTVASCFFSFSSSSLPFLGLGHLASCYRFVATKRKLIAYGILSSLKGWQDGWATVWVLRSSCSARLKTPIHPPCICVKILSKRLKRHLNARGTNYMVHFHKPHQRHRFKACFFPALWMQVESLEEWAQLGQERLTIAKWRWGISWEPSERRRHYPQLGRCVLWLQPVIMGLLDQHNEAFDETCYNFRER